MSRLPDVEGHVLYALRNAQVKEWPFPHFYVEEVFPEDFYQTMVRELVGKADYKEVQGKYHGRTFAAQSCLPGLEWMAGERFLREVCAIFARHVKERFEGRNSGIYGDVRLIRDCKGYFIGPHTDAQWKVVSLLFYMAVDGWFQEHGTSVYLPKDRSFRCKGGPHHKFEAFDLIHTAPYLPNSCFGFFKTDNSFHGVEPIDADFRRDVLLYNVYESRQTP